MAFETPRNINVKGAHKYLGVLNGREVQSERHFFLPELKRAFMLM